MKITFLGAGSTVFVRNIIGDCMFVPALRDAEFALYDIDASRLEESKFILEGIRTVMGAHCTFTCYCGEEKRKDALRGASFVVCAVQVGGYKPSTVIDFAIPNKYGLGQTIGDTTGIGGIMRGLRTIPVLESFARDMEEVCPDALFMNYSNPMNILSGYIQKYTSMKTVGLCHSVQVCAKNLFKRLNMSEYWEGRQEKIFGINHMAWLLEIKDKDGNDLYPEIRRRVAAHEYDDDCGDLVRFDYIRNLGYYCTESSVHHAEYNPFYIKKNYPELIERFKIPLDDYLRRCERNINRWRTEYEQIKAGATQERERSREYGSRIMEAVATDVPFTFNGNVLNTGFLVANLPEKACVEVPIIADGKGLHPQKMGELPLQCAALCMGRVNVDLLTIEAAHSHKLEDVYHAAMFDPHTAAELDIDSIKKMVDELIEAHGDYLPKFH